MTASSAMMPMIDGLHEADGVLAGALHQQVLGAGEEEHQKQRGHDARQAEEDGDRAVDGAADQRQRQHQQEADDHAGHAADLVADEDHHDDVHADLLTERDVHEAHGVDEHGAEGEDGIHGGGLDDGGEVVHQARAAVEDQKQDQHDRQARIGQQVKRVVFDKTEEAGAFIGLLGGDPALFHGFRHSLLLLRSCIR